MAKKIYLEELKRVVHDTGVRKAGVSKGDELFELTFPLSDLFIYNFNFASLS